VNLSAVPSITPREAAAAAEPAAAPEGGPGPAADAPPALIVDVREANEFATERIAGSLFLPISQFVARHGELPRDRPLLMLCASGGRSASATAYLLQAGWTDVRNVTGGIHAWMRDGLPVRRGRPEPGEGTI
jgi:rhodanese-related sulfurtransferase